MKATGIVRRIDDLGRVVIPKEIRRTLRIREGDPLKILAAKSAGANKVIIPSGNWNENFLNYKGIKVIPVSNIKEVFTNW